MSATCDQSCRGTKCFKWVQRFF